MTYEEYEYMQNNTDTSYATTTPPAVYPGIFVSLGLVWLVVMVVMIVAAWKLFKKAGKPGWASIVPFYNTWVLVEIAKLSAVWFVLTFIPVANIVAIIVIYNGISKAFGRGVGTTVLMIFFPYIMLPYLAFSKNVVYRGDAPDNLAATGVTNQFPQNNVPPTSAPTNTPPAAPPTV